MQLSQEAPQQPAPPAPQHSFSQVGGWGGCLLWVGGCMLCVGAGRQIVAARGSCVLACSVRFAAPELALPPHSPSPLNLTPLLRLPSTLRASSPSASPAPTPPASPGARRPLPPLLPAPTCRQWRRRPPRRLPVAWPAPALRPSSRRPSGSSRRRRSAPAAAWRAAPLARPRCSTLVSRGWLAGQDGQLGGSVQSWQMVVAAAIGLQIPTGTTSPPRPLFHTTLAPQASRCRRGRLPLRLVAPKTWTCLKGCL